MAKESSGEKPADSRWKIDLDWYEQNNRSLATLVEGCLCPRCREQLEAGDLAEADLLARIKECCSQVSGFISGEFTILENVFRLFLANGNEPLDLTELSLQLSQRLGDDTYRTSPGILARLLKNARYYGIRQLPV